MVWKFLILSLAVCGVSVCLSALCHAQTFNPPNLVDIEAEIEDVMRDVRKGLHQDPGFQDREHFATINQNFIPQTLPDCSALKTPVWDVPPGVDYTMASLQLDHLTSLLCSFSVDAYRRGDIKRFPGNAGFQLHCSCERQGLLWRKTRFSDQGHKTRSEDWYIYDEVP